MLNCEFEISVSEPSLPIEYAKRFPEDWSLATYKYFPELSISKAVGPVSVCPIGEPGNAVSDPSALIVNSEMELSSLFPVRKSPPKLIVMPKGLFPVAKGDPGTG